MPQLAVRFPYIDNCPYCDSKAATPHVAGCPIEVMTRKVENAIDKDPRMAEDLDDVVPQGSPRSKTVTAIQPDVRGVSR
jgi:hypothetical protein